jgi:hypothetical protein
MDRVALRQPVHPDTPCMLVHTTRREVIRAPIRVLLIKASTWAG